MRYHLAADVGEDRVEGKGTGGVYPASTRSKAAGRIIPQQDGKRQRSQAEGLPACQSVCLVLSSGFTGDPPELHTGGLLVILSRFKARAGWLGGLGGLEARVMGAWGNEKRGRLR